MPNDFLVVESLRIRHQALKIRLPLLTLIRYYQTKSFSIHLTTECKMELMVKLFCSRVWPQTFYPSVIMRTQYRHIQATDNPRCDNSPQFIPLVPAIVTCEHRGDSLHS